MQMAEQVIRGVFYQATTHVIERYSLWSKVCSLPPQWPWNGRWALDAVGCNRAY